MNHDVDALSEDQIKEAIKNWLEGENWRTTIAWGKKQGIDIEAVHNQTQKRWIIEVKGPGSRPPMRVNYFIGILGETLQRMSDIKADYSIALPDLPQYRNLWTKLPSLAKKRTTITLLLITKDGKVSHITHG